MGSVNIGELGKRHRVSFKPGNLYGRQPKPNQDVGNWIRKYAGLEPNDLDGLTYGQAVARAVYEACIKGGDMRACKLILDRIEPAVTVVADITDRLSRDEQLEQIAVNTRSTLDRWACALPGS